MRYGSIDIKSLIGETLSHVDVGDNEIMLTTESGRIIKIYHEPDCCESVRIEDTEGNWHNLVGKVIIETSEEVIDVTGDAKYYDSATRTVLTFKANDVTVINKWIGESNGYYSEEINMEEVASLTGDFKG